MQLLFAHVFGSLWSKTDQILLKYPLEYCAMWPCPNVGMYWVCPDRVQHLGHPPAPHGRCPHLPPHPHTQPGQGDLPTPARPPQGDLPRHRRVLHRGPRSLRETSILIQGSHTNIFIHYEIFFIHNAQIFFLIFLVPSKIKVLAWG